MSQPSQLLFVVINSFHCLAVIHLFASMIVAIALDCHVKRSVFVMEFQFQMAVVFTSVIIDRFIVCSDRRSRLRLKIAALLGVPHLSWLE